jgi:hypothetical protein
MRKKPGTKSINKFNKLFYSKVENAFVKGVLADFFTKIEPVQYSLANLIVKSVKKNPIRVLEIGCGPDTARWKMINDILNDKHLEVRLTDFSSNVLPDIGKLNNAKHKYSASKLNLLRGLKKLPQSSKYDVIIATYVFDSIWFPEDAHYEKKSDNWYKADYRVIINDSFLKKIQLNIKDFNNIKIHKKLVKVDITSEKYGNIIKNYYKHIRELQINFPGGLIKKVIEAFENQLQNKGVFVIGDMAVASKSGHTETTTNNEKPFYMEDYETSGKVAKFKIEDYGLAKLILEKKGFKVELDTVEDFIRNSGYEIPLHIRDHLIIVITK